MPLIGSTPDMLGDRLDTLIRRHGHQTILRTLVDHLYEQGCLGEELDQLESSLAESPHLQPSPDPSPADPNSRYFFVEFYDGDHLVHNTVISSFYELAALCEGSSFRITGEATHEDYLEARAA